MSLTAGFLWLTWATGFYAERTGHLPDAGSFGNGIVRRLVSLYLLLLEAHTLRQLPLAQSQGDASLDEKRGQTGDHIHLGLSDHGVNPIRPLRPLSETFQCASEPLCLCAGDPILSFVLDHQRPFRSTATMPFVLPVALSV